MKLRTLSLGPFIVFVQVVLVTLIVGIVAVAGMNTAKRSLTEIVEQNFRRASVIAGQVLFEELEQSAATAELLALDPQLATLVGDENWKEASSYLYEGAVELSNESVDVLLLVDLAGNLQANAGVLFDEDDDLISGLQGQFSSKSWHVIGGVDKFIVRALPITDKEFGEVLGYLVNGIRLKDNLKIAHKLKRMTGVDSFAIYVADALQAVAPSNAQDILGRNQLTPSHISHRTVLEFGYDQVAYSAPILYLDQPLVDVVMTQDSKGLSSLNAAFKDNALLVLFLIVGGGGIALLVLQRSVISPARNLSTYARSLLTQRDMAQPINSPIKEFDEAGSVVRYVFNQLHETNANLEGLVEERTAALREAEAKTRQVVDSAKDGIITISDEAEILSFNRAAETLFGVPTDEMLGKCVCLLFPEFARGQKCNFSNGRILGENAIDISQDREFIGCRADASTFLMEISVSEFFAADGSRVYVWIIRDITERKENERKLQATLDNLRNTQNELVEAEKMASLGALVAGVAHEINTPVGVGLTAATHLHERAREIQTSMEGGTLKKSDLTGFLKTAQRSTEIVESNLNRASDLVRSFKQVAVDQTSDEVREINLLDYIRDTLRSLQPKLKRTDHSITVDGDKELYIDTHPGAISQVLTNLLMNSITHAFKEDMAGRINIHAHRFDGYVHLTYSDNGRGMPEEVRAKIFDPFFTTERGTGGSGLGMHIVYNQVTQTLGGTIDLTSSPGKGALFSICFPVKTAKETKGDDNDFTI